MPSIMVSMSHTNTAPARGFFQILYPHYLHLHYYNILRYFINMTFQI